MKLKKETRSQVEKILMDLSKIDRKTFTNLEHNLDIEKFNKHPKVIEATNKLRELGITNRGILMDNGFITASMVLTFNN